MARIVDNEGNLLGGLEVSLDRLLAPLNELQRAPIQAPISTPPPQIFGPNDDVRWLVCSYGSLPRVVYSTAENAYAPEAHRQACRNQVDKPQKRHYCPNCGGYYCITHADPAAHACQSVIK